METKEKLIKYASDQSWYARLDDNDIVNIYEATKNLPIVNLKVRKYCYLNNITEYPLYEGNPCKFRDGKYGFYSKTTCDLDLTKDHNLSLNNLKEKLKKYSESTKAYQRYPQHFYNTLSYKELKLILDYGKIFKDPTISECVYAFVHDIKERPKCKACSNILMISRKNCTKKQFCSESCRVSKEGIKISNKHREQTVFEKYGVTHVLSLDEVIKKRQETSLKKYGHTNPGLVASNPVSKWQKDCISEIQKVIWDLDFVLENEACIKIDKNYIKHFSQQYLFPDLLYKNKIVEFNGDYWHANPKLYDSEKLIIDKVKAKDLWKKDRTRVAYFEMIGFEVLTVWELDYTEDKDKVVKQILEFIG